MRWFERRAAADVASRFGESVAGSAVTVVPVGFPRLGVYRDDDLTASVPLDAPLEAVADLLAGIEGPVVAVYPAWAPEPALRRLRTVASAFEGDRVVTWGTSLPPLAGGALAALASAASPLMDGLGALVAILPWLESELVVAVRLGSVAGLRRPAPGLVSHLWSWWPTSSFDVVVWPPSVTRARRATRPPVTVPAHGSTWTLAVAATIPSEAWIGGLMAAFPPPGPTVVRAEPTVLGREWAGTSKLAEAVAVPHDLEAVVDRVLAALPRVVDCRWCGEPVASEPCPCCGMRRVPALTGTGSR